MAEEAHEHSHDHEHSDLARIEAIRDQGVHRVSDIEGPFSLHVLGVGKAGSDVIATLLEQRPKDFLKNSKVRFTALAVDIGDQDVKRVDAAAGGLPADRAQVRTLAMPVPAHDELHSDLNRYREFLKREYPRYYWNPNYEPWIPADLEMPAAGDHFPRAVAKGIYGSQYYQEHQIHQELDDFAASVDASEATPIVCVVFSLGGGTGSGMVVDMVRHLSSVKLGRRPWVVGFGILPCDGDPDEVHDGRLFPVINELDCMIDAEKNKGVMAVWGDLYKNPFTGGFFAVPQDEVHRITGDLDKTHAYVDRGIADFMARDDSVHLYETLKLLNWLGVSADTWHPAIRGEQTDRWLNMLSVRELSDVESLADVGLRDGFETEYAEARVYAAKKNAPSAESLVKTIGGRMSTTIEPGVLTFGAGDHPSVSLVVPHASKLDLTTFVPTREAYDQLSWEEKLLRHSWLVDLGVLLCEPSIRFEGMGGECIWGCACWVVVPHAAIRGESKEPAVAA